MVVEAAPLVVLVPAGVVDVDIVLPVLILVVLVVLELAADVDTTAEEQVLVHGRHWEYPFVAKVQR